MCCKPLAPGGATLTEDWRTAGAADEFILEPHPSVTNPVITKDHITDVPGVLWPADCFIVKEGETFYMFYEARTAEHTYQSYSTSPDGITWTYGSKLSIMAVDKEFPYTQVIKVDGKWYMAPHLSETYVDLYQAVVFPKSWMWHSRLITTAWPLGDATIFQYGGYFWILVGRRYPYYDTYLYYSPTLYGNAWTAHPGNPIVEGIEHWRPGGRPIVRENAVDIFLQDESILYGRAVRPFRLTNLTTTTCTATEWENSPIIGASDIEGTWNEIGMHTLDRVDSTLSIVDGKRDNPGGVDPDDRIYGIGIYHDAVE